MQARSVLVCQNGLVAEVTLHGGFEPLTSTCYCAAHWRRERICNVEITVPADQTHAVVRHHKLAIVLAAESWLQTVFVSCCGVWLHPA